MWISLSLRVWHQNQMFTGNNVIKFHCCPDLCYTYTFQKNERNVHKHTKVRQKGKHVNPLNHERNKSINNVCLVPSIKRQFQEKFRHCRWCNEVTDWDLCVNSATPCPLNMDVHYKSDLPKHLRIHQREDRKGKGTNGKEEESVKP